MARRSPRLTSESRPGGCKLPIISGDLFQGTDSSKTGNVFEQMAMMDLDTFLANEVAAYAAWEAASVNVLNSRPRLVDCVFFGRRM